MLKLEDLEDSYRIPMIHEFVQGFEFERRIKRGGSSWFIMDFSKSKEQIQEEVDRNRSETYYEWLPMKVWWKPRDYEESIRTIKDIESGITVTYFISDFDSPLSLEEELEGGNIRCKIKQ